VRSLTVAIPLILCALAACSTLHPVILTGRVIWPDSTGVDAWVRLRGPGLPWHRARGHTPEDRTDAAGRFQLRHRLARGCYAANLLTFETTHIVEWHFWVGGADSLAMGAVMIWPGSGQSGEGVNHLVLGCGAQDTLQPMYSWHYDTVRVTRPTR
jgi:hypothetical protein